MTTLIVGALRFRNKFFGLRASNRTLPAVKPYHHPDSESRKRYRAQGETALRACCAYTVEVESGSDSHFRHMFMSEQDKKTTDCIRVPTMDERLEVGKRPLRFASFRVHSFVVSMLEPIAERRVCRKAKGQNMSIM